MTAARGAALLVFGLVVVAAAWTAWPRGPNLVVFDPDRLAAADTAMWRAYYDKRYVALFAELYALQRDAFGFSPLDSVRLAYDAADAARRFQPTRSRAEAEAARPALAAYFAILAKGAPKPFDSTAAADRELDWWQARREHVGPDDYGLRIAAVSRLVYGFDSEALRQAGIARARAMAFRDSRDAGMTDEDWRRIEEDLRRAYATLRAALDAARPSKAS